MSNPLRIVEDQNLDVAAEAPQPTRRLVCDLVRTHWETLVTHARCRLAEQAGWAEDVVADAIAAMATGELGERRVEPRQILAFAKRVVAFKALHVRRRESRVVEWDESQVPTILTDPWAAVRMESSRRQMMWAVKQLPPGERAAIRDVYTVGLSVDEIARKNGISHEAVWQRISRGRRRLRKLLGPRHSR